MKPLWCAAGEPHGLIGLPRLSLGHEIGLWADRLRGARPAGLHPQDSHHSKTWAAFCPPKNNVSSPIDRSTRTTGFPSPYSWTLFTPLQAAGLSHREFCRRGGWSCPTSVLSLLPNEY